MTLIAAASKSRRRISQVVEVTRGTTPTSPSFKIVPQLDSSQLNITQSFERSAQVQSNRMGGKQVGGSVEAGGTLAVPLKKDDAVKELIESLFSCTMAHVSIDGSGGNPDTLAFDNVSVRASGTITITNNTNLTDGDTFTINGTVFTAKSSGATGNQFNIGADVNASAAALQAVLDASVVAGVAVATYTVNSATITITYDTPGTGGNSFTLAVSDATAASVSGATLSGGTAGVDRITRATGSFIEDGFHVGDQITVTNATTTGNNIANSDLVTIATLTDTIMTLSSTLTDIEILTADESFGSSTTLSSRSWYGEAGTTRQFFTHEVAFLDLSPVVYEYYRGNEVNTGTINIPTSGEATLEMQMVGVEGQSTTTAVSGGTYAAVAGTASFAGSVTGSALYRDGSTSIEVESITINIDNQRAAKFAVGQSSASHIEEGDFNIEAQMSLYLKDNDVTTKFLAGTRSTLEVVLADQQDGHKMAIEMPNVVFTTADKGVSGMTVSQNVTAYGEEDSTYATKARVWIIPAASAS